MQHLGGGGENALKSHEFAVLECFFSAPNCGGKFHGLVSGDFLGVSPSRSYLASIISQSLVVFTSLSLSTDPKNSVGDVLGANVFFSRNN